MRGTAKDSAKLRRRKGTRVDWLNLLALAVALAMDAFAVAIVTGLTLKPLTRRHVVRMSFSFGLFQALMPVIGWAAGHAVHRYIAAFDHWVAFGLLAFIGGKMIGGAFLGKDEGHSSNDPTAGWNLILLSLATSIDALAVGLSLAMVGSSIVVPSLIIGLTAAAFTATGMIFGKRIGNTWGRNVEVLGGLILLAIGARILITHLWP